MTNHKHDWFFFDRSTAFGATVDYQKCGCGAGRILVDGAEVTPPEVVAALHAQLKDASETGHDQWQKYQATLREYQTQLDAAIGKYAALEADVAALRAALEAERARGNSECHTCGCDEYDTVQVHACTCAREKSLAALAAREAEAEGFKSALGEAMDDAHNQTRLRVEAEAEVARLQAALDKARSAAP